MINIVGCNRCLVRLGESEAPACVAACSVEAFDAGPMEELVAEYGELRELEKTGSVAS